MKNQKSKIVVITGPTAIGKSEIAIDMALKFNGEIVSADSMQIYKRMDIGTGKILDARGVRHHMIDIINHDEEYSVQQYITTAKEVIEDIIIRKKLPIITGGTGLYITSLINNNSFAQISKDEEIRKKFQKVAEEKGAKYLYDMLVEVDEPSSKKIESNDLKRIIRALEIFTLTGKTKSQLADKKIDPIYDYLLFVLNESRENLYKKIEMRIDKMLEKGLVKEVELLNPSSTFQSMQAIGYKEVISFLENQINYEEMVYRLKLNTRHYAKRQMTYFKNMPLNKIMIDIENIDKMALKIKEFINKDNI